MQNEVTVQDIQNSIISLPNRPPAMLASQVAELYQVKTEQINRAVKRNPDRFPDDFCFRLSEEEFENLVCQNGRPINSLGRFGGHLPWMFTRFGANQLSTVLKSPVAAVRSVQIMRAFSTMEEMAQQDDSIFSDPAFLAGIAEIFKSGVKATEIPAEYVPAIQTIAKEARLDGAHAGIKLVQRLKASGLPEDFLDKLIRYRLRGNTLRETAKLLDVSQSMVRRYESLALRAGMISKTAQGKVVNHD